MKNKEYTLKEGMDLEEIEEISITEEKLYKDLEESLSEVDTASIRLEKRLF